MYITFCYHSYYYSFSLTQVLWFQPITLIRARYLHFISASNFLSYAGKHTVIRLSHVIKSLLQTYNFKSWIVQIYTDLPSFAPNSSSTGLGGRSIRCGLRNASLTVLNLWRATTNFPPMYILNIEPWSLDILSNIWWGCKPVR